MGTGSTSRRGVHDWRPRDGLRTLPCWHEPRFATLDCVRSSYPRNPANVAGFLILTGETDMAAELEFRNGEANIFYSKAGGTPWHKEGVAITGDEQFDFDGLMTRHFAYPLQKLPYYVP